jgi:hypothetical protein
MTVVGLPIGVYASRPVLAVTSLAPSDIHNNNGSKASITVTGTGIRDVMVRCVTNKVIFEDKNTLALPRFTVIDEYSVRDVAAGESFTADCNFAWSLWTTPANGFFLMGGGAPGKPQLGIPFLFDDGLPSVIPGTPIPATLSPDFKQRRVHMIARRNDGELKWRVAPNSEPTIPDATDGFVVTASGPPKQWGVTMTLTNW